MNFNFEENKNKIIEFFQKYWIPVVGTIIALAVIISCVNIYKERVLDIEDDVKYVAQDTIYIPANAMDTLNPITTVTEDSYYINKLIYDNLFEFDASLNVTPSLVESYSVNTEKAYIDIKLKKGIKFHNGKELTANDVKFTVNAIQSHGAKGLFYSKASKIYSVNVEKDHELRIYFKNNYESGLDSLTFPIVCASQYDSVSAFLKAKDFVPVGTGQYKVDNYDSYKDLSLSPNSSYFGTVARNNILVQIVPDKNNLANLIENDTVTCYVDKGSDRKTMVTDNDLKMFDMISNEVDFVYFNNSGVFKDANMRKAVAYAIDSESVLEKGYMNDGVLTDTIYYPNFLGVKDTKQSYIYDEAKANMLITKAGFVDKDKDGKLEDAKKKPLAVTILVNSNNANRIAAAKVISNNLEKVGFTVTVNSVPWEEYQKLIKSKSFDILITGYSIEETYDLRTLYNGKALWGYKNNNIYNQSRKLERLYSAEEYQKHYSDLKAMLIEELPYYPLCYKKMGLIGNSTLEASKLPMFNNIYDNIDTWRWTKAIKEMNN